MKKYIRRLFYRHPTRREIRLLRYKVKIKNNTITIDDLLHLNNLCMSTGVIWLSELWFVTDYLYEKNPSMYDKYCVVTQSKNISIENSGETHKKLKKKKKKENKITYWSPMISYDP